MIDEFKKSINSILYERLTSPLYGTFIVSWSIWNWRIIYLTFFVSENKIGEKTKIQYIVDNFYDINLTVVYPLISTIALLTIGHLISNGAYWLHLWLNKWRSDKKHKVELSQLLTIEQSIELRSELSEKGKNFESLLSGKDSEIDRLIIEINELKEKMSFKLEDGALESEELQTAEKNKRKQILISKIQNNLLMKQTLYKVYEYIQRNLMIGTSVDSKFVAYFESNKLINNKGEGKYEFTEFGKEVYGDILDMNL